MVDAFSYPCAVLVKSDVAARSRSDREAMLVEDEGVQQVEHFTSSVKDLPCGAASSQHAKLGLLLMHQAFLKRHI
eukprot:scaffold657_cov245-Pinguiococcus_pyrenoidosus.AAC.4